MCVFSNLIGPCWYQQTYQVVYTVNKVAHRMYHFRTSCGMWKSCYYRNKVKWRIQSHRYTLWGDVRCPPKKSLFWINNRLNFQCLGKFQLRDSLIMIYHSMFACKLLVAVAVQSLEKNCAKQFFRQPYLQKIHCSLLTSYVYIYMLTYHLSSILLGNLILTSFLLA